MQPVLNEFLQPAFCITLMPCILFLPYSPLNRLGKWLSKQWVSNILYFLVSLECCWRDNFVVDGAWCYLTICIASQCPLHCFCMTNWIANELMFDCHVDTCVNNGTPVLYTHPNSFSDPQLRCSSSLGCTLYCTSRFYHWKLSVFTLTLYNF